MKLPTREPRECLLRVTSSLTLQVNTDTETSRGEKRAGGGGGVRCWLCVPQPVSGPPCDWGQIARQPAQMEPPASPSPWSSATAAQELPHNQGGVCRGKVFSFVCVY